MNKQYSTTLERVEAERLESEGMIKCIKQENSSLIEQIASLEEDLDAQNKLIQALKAVNNENQRDIDALRKLQKATVERCRNLERSVSALRKQIVDMKEHGYIRDNY